jgi:hypothetical protein
MYLPITMMSDYDYQNSADSYDFGAPMYDCVDNLEQDNLIRRRPFHSHEVDFDDPKISSLPKVLLMGPRRGGKTSIQVGSMQAFVYEFCCGRHYVSTIQVNFLFICFSELCFRKCLLTRLCFD